MHTGCKPKQWISPDGNITGNLNFLPVLICTFWGCVFRLHTSKYQVARKNTDQGYESKTTGSFSIRKDLKDYLTQIHYLSMYLGYNGTDLKDQTRNSKNTSWMIKIIYFQDFLHSLSMQKSTRLNVNSFIYIIKKQEKNLKGVYTTL